MMSRRGSRGRWLALLMACFLLLAGLPGSAVALTPFAVTAPTASAVWYPGSSATITWTGGDPTMLVNLSLVDVPAWTVVAGIASAIPNSGSYTWTVPAGLPAGTYLVYIEDTKRTTWSYGESFAVAAASGKPDLAIAKKTEGPLQAGQPGAYVITVTNVGSGPANGPIIVTDTLGPGLSFVSAAGAGWTCTNAGATVTCTNPGPLPASTSLPPILISVMVARDAQKVENCASVTTEKPQDSNLANNRACIGSTTTPPLTGSICGYKFNDANRNGKQDTGEVGLSGWTILLLDSSGHTVASVVTGSDGEYCFKGLSMGAYTLAEANQVGWIQTSPSTGTYSVTLTSRQPNVTRFDFGNNAQPTPGIICGVKFHDLNGNGVQDGREPELPGWTIEMRDAAGNLVASVTTGRDGRFCFREVKPGTYTFAEVMKPNWQQTAPAAPGTYVVTVSPGNNAQVLLFGNQAKQDPCCLTFPFMAGRPDQFAVSDGLEPAAPSPTLVASIPGSLSAYFDGKAQDRFFAHTFTLPVGNCIRSARLEVVARPLSSSSLVANDSIALRFTGVAGSPTWSSYIGSGNASPGQLPLPWKLPNYGAGQLITLDLANLSGSVNFLPTLQAQRFVDLVIQDDTSIDYVRLTVEFCECSNNDQSKEEHK